MHNTCCKFTHMYIHLSTYNIYFVLYTCTLGDTLNFNVTIKPAATFPLDVYFLMDLSDSMNDDLDTLKRFTFEISNYIYTIMYISIQMNPL